MAAKLAKIQHGGDRKSDEIKVSIDTSIQKAAKQLQVGRATVARAKAVLANGSQELIEAVEQGKVAVSKAAAVVKEVPKEKQLQAATEVKLLEKKPEELSRAEQRLRDQDLDQEAVVDFLIGNNLSQLVRNRSVVSRLSQYPH